MKKLMIAVAMTIALPGGALAQAAPAPSAAAPAAHSGHDVKAPVCGNMHMSGRHGDPGASARGQAGHSRMDHCKMDHSKMPGEASGHQAPSGR